MLSQTAAVHGISSQPEVWEKLWTHEPTDEKDDSLLARETSHPRWHLLRAEMESRIGPLSSLSALEMGSGRGDLSAILAGHGAGVTLLDASGRALDQARRRFDRLRRRADFVRSDLFEPPKECAGRFDVVLSSGVIEHFQGGDRTRAIEAHARCARPGALVAISVPHAACPTYRLWKAYLELRGWWPYGVEIPFSRREMRHRAEQAGLEAIKVCTLGFWQSVGDHLIRPLTGRRVDWSIHPSRYDAWLGGTLLLVGQAPQAGTRERRSTCEY